MSFLEHIPYTLSASASSPEKPTFFPLDSFLDFFSLDTSHSPPPPPQVQVYHRRPKGPTSNPTLVPITREVSDPNPLRRYT